MSRGITDPHRRQTGPPPTYVEIDCTDASRSPIPPRPNQPSRISSLPESDCPRTKFYTIISDALDQNGLVALRPCRFRRTSKTWPAPSVFSELNFRPCRRLYVEDHLPGYLSEYLQGLTHPDVLTIKYIVNRKALHYVFRWVARKTAKRPCPEMYLKKTGLVTPDQPMPNAARAEDRLHLPIPAPGLEGFVYLALRKRRRTFIIAPSPRRSTEPLSSLLTKMGLTRPATGRFLRPAIKCHKGEPGCPGPQVSAVSETSNAGPVQPDQLPPQLLSLMRSAPQLQATRMSSPT